jgi:Na+-driven multidrug efflux pump
MFYCPFSNSSTYFGITVSNQTIFDTIDLALVSNFVGTDAASAYVVADTFISMTDEFIAGIGDAQGTLCPHALGAGNNTLAGQYVQIGILVFLIASIPILAVWCLFIDRAILWFGLSPHVAKIGLEWTRIAALHYIVAGISESVVGLLEISDHEAWVAIVDLVFGLLDAAAVALTVTTWKVTLSTVAWIHLAAEVLCFIFIIVAATSKGWYRQFYQGLIGSCAFKVCTYTFRTCFKDCRIDTNRPYFFCHL